MLPIRAEKIAHSDSIRKSTGEILGSLADLSRLMGLSRLNVYHEVLPPGHRSSPLHAHTHKEEFVFVIKGTAKVLANEEVYEITDGDVAGFPVGLAHMIFNDSDEAVELLVVSTAGNIEDKITFLPDDAIRSVMISNA